MVRASERRRRATSSPDGAAVVEFALILPLLLLLLVGIIEFGFAWYRNQTLEAAAREGARTASVGGTLSEIGDAVEAAVGLADPSDLSVAVSPAGDPPCQDNFGEEVSVTVTLPSSAGYSIDIPFWGSQPLSIATAGTFRCEKGG